MFLSITSSFQFYAYDICNHFHSHSFPSRRSKLEEIINEINQIRVNLKAMLKLQYMRAIGTFIRIFVRFY